MDNHGLFALLVQRGYKEINVVIPLSRIPFNMSTTTWEIESLRTTRVGVVTMQDFAREFNVAIRDINRNTDPI